jgi:hypothetical protein
LLANGRIGARPGLPCPRRLSQAQRRHLLAELALTRLIAPNARWPASRLVDTDCRT